MYHNLRLIYVRLSWVEPNTNVALSKNTIVGTSNVLSVGADNKLNIKHNSSEYIGGDKEITIKGNVDSKIEGDKSSEIMGNVVERVEGEYKLIANNKLNLESSNETTIRTKGNLLLTSNESMGLETDKNATFIADNMLSQATSDYNLQAGNIINLQINGTTINATSDKITFKAGGVEVIIDSNGLAVKGGEIRSE